MTWIGSQRRQGCFLEIIQCVRRTILERIIRDESIAYILLLFTDHSTQFEGQSRRNRDSAGNVLIIVHDLRGPTRRKRPTNNVGSVVIADARDQRIEVECLSLKRRLG